MSAHTRGASSGSSAVSTRAAVTAALAVAHVAAQGLTTACGWSYTAPGASGVTSTWDVSAMTLQVATGGYVATDLRARGSQYIFNVCGVTPPPALSNNACNRTYGGASVTAWQTQGNNMNAQCYTLGTNASAGWNFSIYDPLYPARGFMLTYPYGDSTWCPPGRSRSLTIEFLCSSLIPTGSGSYGLVTVSEENQCDYHVQLPSIYACPTQCLTSGAPNPVICSGNGVCGYNTDSKMSQCFCNNGYNGATCNAGPPPPAGLSAEGIILILVCIVLAGVLGLLGYMLVKLRRLQVDPAAYGQLTNKFNELGQLA